MKMAQKVVFLLTLVMAISAFSVCLAADKVIRQIKVTVPPVTIGGARIESGEIKISNSGKHAGSTWVNRSEHRFMVDTETYEEGVEYELRLFFVPADGCTFEDTPNVILNGESVKAEKVAEPNQYKIIKVFTPVEKGSVTQEVEEPEEQEEEEEEEPKEEQRFLEWMKIKIEEPVSGEELPITYQIKTNFDEKYITYRFCKQEGTVCKWSPETRYVLNEQEYKFGFQFNIKAYKAELAEDFKTSINGEEVDWERHHEDFVSFGTVIPVIGKISEVTPTPTSTPTPIPTKENVEETTEETKKVTWTVASDWAVEELNKANEKELIPPIFEDVDLTTSITRKEFAHVAVKLWEKISGQTMAAGPKDPFADTDDPEVLKAYNLEITNGTSENTFSPDDLITREEMATMLTRALKKAGIDTTVDLANVTKFADDAQMHDWGKEAIYYMASVGLIKGVGGNNFDVVGDASKEQSIVISVRSTDKFGK